MAAWARFELATNKRFKAVRVTTSPPGNIMLIAYLYIRAHLYINTLMQLAEVYFHTR